MKIMMTGDVVGRPGRKAFSRYTPDLRKKYDIDVVIVNGENSAGGKGFTRKSLDELYAAGADIVTSGNHVWDKKDVLDFIDDEPYLVRPGNYPDGTPGKGWCIYPFRKANIAVMNLSGRAFMPALDDPFRVVDDMLEDIKKYKDKGLELSDNAQKQFQAFIIKLTGSIHETLTNEADLFNKGLNDIVTQQQDTLDKLKDDLKKNYDDEIKELSNNYAQLTAKTERLNDRILIPRKDFWVLMLLSSAIFLGGFISWVKFWRVPGNDVTMNWMVAAGIMEFIYIISTGLNSLIYREETKGESTKKDDDKEEIRLYSMSLSQALYFMLLTLAAGVYVVWYALDCYASPAWMKYLLPVALALNFIWMMLNGILARIFSSER